MKRGDIVKIKGWIGEETAIVKSIGPGTSIVTVYLDKPLDGHKVWLIDELEVVTMNEVNQQENDDE